MVFWLVVMSYCSERVLEKQTASIFRIKARNHQKQRIAQLSSHALSVYSSRRVRRVHVITLKCAQFNILI
jgi:hypothetical protein